MTMDDWVLVDTCIWASFFAKPASPEKSAVDDLLDSDRVALVGPIVAEVLMGFRRREQADWVASRLRLAHYLEADWDDWKSAAEIGRLLARRNHRIPLSDLLVASVAKRRQSWIYSTGPHFDVIPEIKRYSPGA